jgi:hypothetical protein
MKTAITIIAVCEVIRTIQITVDIVFGFKSRRAALESINKVGDSVADDVKSENIARAIVKEAVNEGNN